MENIHTASTVIIKGLQIFAVTNGFDKEFPFYQPRGADNAIEHPRTTRAAF